MGLVRLPAAAAVAAAVLSVVVLRLVAPVAGDNFWMPTTGYGKGSTYLFDDAENQKGYRPPNRDNYSCMKQLKKMYYRNIQDDDDQRCMSCDKAPGGTRNQCPTGCQGIIDALYKDCDGITVPDGFYFDEARTLPGRWSDDQTRHIRGRWRGTVEDAITLEVRTCGCSAAASLHPGWATALLVAASLWWLVLDGDGRQPGFGWW